MHHPDLLGYLPNTFTSLPAESWNNACNPSNNYLNFLDNSIFLNGHNIPKDDEYWIYQGEIGQILLWQSCIRAFLFFIVICSAFVWQTLHNPRNHMQYGHFLCFFTEKVIFFTKVFIRISLEVWINVSKKDMNKDNQNQTASLKRKKPNKSI